MSASFSFANTELLGLVFCDQSAVAMRSGARLPSAEFTLLSRSGSTSRTAEGEYLFGSECFLHQDRRVLSFCDNRHGSIFQKRADKCAIYLQAAVVVDEAFLLERAHEFAHPCAGGTDHLR
jgi:hypothetical protein